MKFYEFEDFRIDTEERALYRDGSPVSLTPKVFDVLLALVLRQGRVVSKENLMDEIWRDAAVEESNLTQNVFTLRRALGEKAGGKKFIETVSRRGYRFLPEVRIVEIADELPKNGEIRANEFFEKVKSQKEFENDAAIQTMRKVSPPNNSAESHFFEKPARTQIYNRPILIFGFVALIVIASLGLAFRYGWRQNARVSNSNETKLRRLTDNGNLSGAAISPDGNLLAYVEVEGKNNSIRLKNIQTESEVVVPPSESPLASPSFSPDGNFIYYKYVALNKNAVVFQVPVFGGEPRQIAADLWGNFSVSPDGKEIAFPREDKAAKKHYIVVTETDGGGERIVAARNLPEFFELWGPAPAWSPDGEHVTVDARSFGENKSHLIEIGLRDGTERELKTQIAWRYIERLAWANENELVVDAEEKDGDKFQLWSVKFPSGEATRVTNDLNDYIGFNLTKDATKIVAEQEIQDFHLWLFDDETKTARQITFGENHADGIDGLAFAPDNRIVFTAQDKNEYDIFSADMNGGDIRQLTKHTGRENVHAVVSPDNRFIAFVSDRTGKRRLWLMNTDGTQARQLTQTTNDEQIDEEAPFFSPDGRWIYYARAEGERASIWKVSIDGGEAIEAVHSNRDFFLPVVSPDGKFLAHSVFDDKSSSPWSIGVYSLETGTEKVFHFPANRALTRWTPDSNSLVSIGGESIISDLWQTNLVTGERRKITNFNAERIERFDVSRDGRFFVISRGSEFYDAVLIER